MSSSTATSDVVSDRLTDLSSTAPKAYLVGGGIASMAAAAFLIRDGDMLGRNITIFEELGTMGGSLDGSGSAGTGYVLRGGRMLADTSRLQGRIQSARALQGLQGFARAARVTTPEKAKIKLAFPVA